MERSLLTIEFNVDKFIQESKVLNEISVPSLGKFGTVNLSVNGNEGNIPHFHLKWKGNVICICLYFPYFFYHKTHPESKSYSGKMGKIEKELLNKFLSKVNPRLGITYWMELSNKWLSLYVTTPKEREKFSNICKQYGVNPSALVQPDYNLLDKGIDEI